MNAGTLEEAVIKQIYPPLPVVLVKASHAGQDGRARHLPVPRLQDAAARPHRVFAAGLKTKAPPAKWVMAGVSMLLDVAE